MDYQIKTMSDPSRLCGGNAAEVSVCNWGGDYRPEVRAVLCYVKDQGFLIRMTAAEQNPLSVQTAPNSAVCTDSCLEFFANFKPELPGSGYINFEVNSIGTTLSFYGPDRFTRTSLVELGAEHPKPRAFRSENEWGWEYLIPLSLIEKVYGNADYKTGDVIRANFYKCGDHTEHVHYLSFTAIQSDHPDFHRPEAFARMEITD